MTIAEAVLFCILLAAIVISDERSHRIPNVLVAAGMVLRACVMLGSGSVQELIASAVMALVLTVPLLFLTIGTEAVVKKRVLGGGDLKLCFLLSLFFPWQIALFGILGSLFIGAAAGMLSKAAAPERKRFPMAAAIAGGFFLAALYGAKIMEFWGNHGEIV